MKLNKFAALAVLGAFALSSFSSQAAVTGWTNWRGPHQNGVTDEKGLPDQIDPTKNLLWSYDIAGRGAPVIANGKVYACINFAVSNHRCAAAGNIVAPQEIFGRINLIG